jgi:hypothetical protein
VKSGGNYVAKNNLSDALQFDSGPSSFQKQQIWTTK